MTEVTTTNTSIAPPDEEELLLSRLVFGETSDEFSKNLMDTINTLQDFDELNAQEEDTVAQDDHEDDNDEDKMDLVNNDQLFYIDEEGGDGDDDNDNMDVDRENLDSDDESSGEESEDAWEDSDDENVDVNLWDNNRTKKLKTSYVEKSINGSEYADRLRTQFEKIYPKPDWTLYNEEKDGNNALGQNNEDGDLGDDADEGENTTTSGDVSALLKILQTTVSVHSKDQRTKLLPSEKINVIRMKDANHSKQSHSAIQSISFHPSGLPIFLTGGYDKSLRLYHIDGKSNPLVTSLYLQGTPIQTASIYVNPTDQEQITRVYTGGRRRYMHSWTLTSSSNTGNLNINKISRMYGHEQTQRSFENFKMGHFFTSKKECHGIICLQGNNGWINILHASTSQYFTGLKINGTIADFCIDYTTSSSTNTIHTHIIAINTFGEIWEFDLNEGNKVVKNWKDDNNFGITKIQVGGGANSMSSSYLIPKDLTNISQNRWLAIGSESGIVTVYDRFNASTQKTPITVDALTTSISSIEFSHDGQVLCVASRSVKDAMRLVHLPSGSVFKNWPNSGTPLGKITSVKFSNNSEYLATGNLQGKVRLWRLSHYY